MKLTQQQLAHGVANSIVSDYNNLATQVKSLITQGGKVDGVELTAEEIKQALYDNLGKVEAITNQILE